MVKHTLKTIRRQKPTNSLSVFDHFLGLALKGLRHAKKKEIMNLPEIYFLTSTLIL